MKQNRSSLADQAAQEAFWLNLGWLFSKAWRATCGGIWLFVLCSFAVFFLTWARFYYYGAVKGEKSYEMAYRDLKKMAMQLCVGFGIFVLFTYAVCLKNYEAFLEGLQLGVVFNLALSPVYYKWFGDEHEFKINQF